MHLTDLNRMDFANQQPVQSSALQLSSSPPQNWLHSPPTQMPWGTTQPSLVRFTANANNGVGGNGSRYIPQGCMSQVPSSFTQTTPVFSQSSPMSSSSHTQSTFGSSYAPVNPHGIKRKLNEADDAEMLCAVNKLHISENRLKSHQKGNVHALSQLAKSAIRSVNEVTTGQRVILSQELQQLSRQGESLLPQPIIDRMRGPSMALVLWQPPPRPMASAQIMPPSDDEDDDDADNNNSSTLDLNNLPSFTETNAQANPPPTRSLIDEDDIDMEAL